MSSNRLIPKDQSTAFQRWEMGSFDAQKQSDPDTPVKLPTAAELEAMQQQAHDEAYTLGFEQGRVEAERMHQLTQSYSDAVSKIEGTIAEDLLSLALDIAKQVLREALVVKPELILPVVREALASLAEPRQNPVLFLNPADVELVTFRIGDVLAIDGWKVLADERIEAGGCRVDSANGEVNATLATRWQRTIATLGRDHAWLS
jgi:flagellar assembly protein FliH